MATKASISKAKYDSQHCKGVYLKLNIKTDADILEKLASVPNVQGYIKSLIRQDIGSVPDAASVPENESEEESMNNWEYIVSLMDDEIRESVHADLAPCTNKEFLDEYMKRHYEKYNAEFTY